MKFNIFILCGIFFFIFVFIQFLILYFLKNNSKLKKILIDVFSSIYFVTLILGTVTKLNYIYPNLEFSFDFNYKWFSFSFIFFNFSLNNIFINMCLFFPIGIFLFVFFENLDTWKIIFFTFSVSLFIEIYQFILPIHRDSEIGDIILNTIGGTISYFICKIFKNCKII